jgi:Kdo2-lipid IVA lauroyltransferase/acyltransferase
MAIARKLLKSIGKDMGWLVLSRVLASLKKDNNIKVLHRRAELIASVIFFFAKSRRKLLLSNLAIAFPEWSDTQINETARKAVRNICRGLADSFYYSYHPHMLPGNVIFEENGVMEDLLSRGSGCVVVTGHVGVFPFLGTPMIANGVPFGPIVRDPHDMRVKYALDDVRERIGYTLIPDRPPMTVLKRSVKVLRKGGGVMIAFDMHPADRVGIKTEFLGRKTPMFGYAVRLAAKMRVPIVPGHVLLEPDGLRHRVTYYPPIDVPKDAVDPNSPVAKELLQGLADWLSGVIKNHPEQYWWIHRRWRE